MMNTYEVKLSYEDRKGSQEGRTIKIDASNIAGAIGKATREFVKSLDRKQRFDMNKGLKIEALRATGDKAPEAAMDTSA
jgi:hypothetical protein